MQQDLGLALVPELQLDLRTTAALLLAPTLHRLLVRRTGVTWQFYPSHAGLLAAFLGWHLAALACGLLSGLLLWAIPVPTITGVESTFSVGYVEYEHADPDNAQPTIGRLLYPAREHHEEVAPYVAMNDRHGLARRFIAIATPEFLKPFLPAWLLTHWRVAPFPAKLAAAPYVPSDAHGRLPVVVFSHGLTATRETSTSLALSLAGAGCVVLLVEHTDRSATLARFHDGTALEFDEGVAALGIRPETEAYRWARREQTEHRVQDLQRTLRLLEQIERGADAARRIRFDGVAPETAAALATCFEGRLALDRVVAGGHSFGGVAAISLAACAGPDAVGVAAKRVAGAHKKAASPRRARSPVRTNGASPHGVVSADGAPAVVAATFLLDPALDWLPERVWPDMLYDVASRGKNALPTCPPLLRRVPTLMIWSTEWLHWGFFHGYQSAPPAAAAPHSETLHLAKSGHQGLCDLALSLPHWLNKVLGTSWGLPSPSMASSVNLAVLGFLRNVGVVGGPRAELKDVPHMLTPALAEAGRAPLEGRIRVVARANRVLIYSKTSCGYCARAKALFDSLGERYIAVELDVLDEGPEYRRLLKEMTGQSTVPCIFVKGEFLGGNDAAQSAHASGRLAQMLGKK